MKAAERLDPDYNPSEAELERLASILGRVMGRMTAVTYHESNGNGGKLLKWFLGLLLVLVPMGIAGEIIVYGRQEASDARNAAQYAAIQQQLSDLKKMVSPIFRGVPAE